MARPHSRFVHMLYHAMTNAMPRCAVPCYAPCSDAEFKGSWARVHIDLGTADELALDVLLNMLVGFSFEVSGNCHWVDVHNVGTHSHEHVGGPCTQRDICFGQPGWGQCRAARSSRVSLPSSLSQCGACSKCTKSRIAWSFAAMCIYSMGSIACRADVLQVSGISRIMVGGEHERWEVPPRVDAEDELGWDQDDGRPKKQHGQAPKVRYCGRAGVSSVLDVWA